MLGFRTKWGTSETQSFLVSWNLLKTDIEAEFSVKKIKFNLCYLKFQFQSRFCCEIKLSKISKGFEFIVDASEFVDDKFQLNRNTYLQYKE